jgi:hypothetical protein
MSNRQWLILNAVTPQQKNSQQDASDKDGDEAFFHWHLSVLNRSTAGSGC